VTIAEVRRLVGRIPPYALATRFPRRPLRHIARFILISVYGCPKERPQPGDLGKAEAAIALGNAGLGRTGIYKTQEPKPRSRHWSDLKKVA
jgi:hypothetical protein